MHYTLKKKKKEKSSHTHFWTLDLTVLKSSRKQRMGTMAFLRYFLKYGLKRNYSQNTLSHFRAVNMLTNQLSNSR